MDTRIDTLSVAVTADTAGFRRELAESERLARGFGAGAWPAGRRPPLPWSESW